MSIIVSALPVSEASALIPQLAGLLQHVVDGGAALGFLAPLSPEGATAYWQEVVQDLEAGPRLLLVARHAETNEVLGTVQLDPATRPNGLHRAEVAKMMVHSKARRQGIGRQLLQALETQARQLGRTTLVLDTREGDVAEPLYQGMGYQRAGRIPDYARSSDGTLHATVVYYKLLGAEAESSTAALSPNPSK
ncbi:GNAT family N-acetyltransferase [Hymenobacter saemangeumensis]|uniref:GNAT family N-acetyltransferase n=1 Tax=Hymenobacter saemangeumensis TaxID=1084522 RepID=A0ABP8ISF3_9BACT